MPLIASSVLCTFFIFMLGMAYHASWSSISVVVFLCAVMFSFSLAIGPFTWIVVAEVLPQRCRAKGTMLGIFVNRITSGIVALSALSTAKLLGFSGFFFFYTAISALSVLFYVAFIPETVGRTLMDIERMLAKPSALSKWPCAQRHLDGDGRRGNSIL